MNTLLIRIVIAVFLCQPFLMGQGEIEQYLLRNAGDRFELWRSGLGNVDRALFSYDSEMKVGENPSLRISSSGDTQGGAQRLRMPIQVQPFTTYEIRYKMRIGQPGSPEVKIVAGLCDEGREEVASVSHALAAKVGGDAWADGVMRFQTGREHRFIQVQLVVPPKFTGPMWLGGMYVEQTGTAGALRPSGAPVFEQLGFSLKAGSANPPASDLNAVPPGNAVATISFDLLHRGIAGEATLAVDWLATTEPGSVVAQDRCLVDRLEGIEGPWNSIRAQWHRKAGGPLDGVSYQLDLFPDTAPKAGEANISRDLAIPPGAKYVRVSVLPGGQFRGTLDIRRLRLVAMPN